MVDVTLIELHVDDAKLNANAPGSSGMGGKLLGMLSSSGETKSGKSSSGTSENKKSSGGKNKKSSGSKRKKKSSRGRRKAKKSAGSKNKSEKKSSGRSSKLPALVGLLFLIAIAVVAKKRMGSSDSVPELESVKP